MATTYKTIKDLTYVLINNPDKTSDEDFAVSRTLPMGSIVSVTSIDQTYQPPITTLDTGEKIYLQDLQEMPVVAPVITPVAKTGFSISSTNIYVGGGILLLGIGGYLYWKQNHSVNN